MASAISYASRKKAILINFQKRSLTQERREINRYMVKRKRENMREREIGRKRETGRERGRDRKRDRERKKRKEEAYLLLRILFLVYSKYFWSH